MSIIRSTRSRGRRRTSLPSTTTSFDKTALQDYLSALCRDLRATGSPMPQGALVSRREMSRIRAKIISSGGRIIKSIRVPGTPDVFAIVWEPADTKNDVFLTDKARQQAAIIAVRTGDSSGVKVPAKVRALAKASSAE